MITVTGLNPTTHQAGTVYTDASVTANDAVDGSVTVNSDISATNPNISVLGTYTITYTATDSSGNVSTATRVVNVVDTTGPTITLTEHSTLGGVETVNIQTGQTYVDPGATATDNYDAGAINVTTTSNNVDTSALGAYTVSYQAQDSLGNTTTSSRTVNVVDTTTPVMNLIGSNAINVNIDGTYTELGVTITDNGNDVSSNVIITNGTVDTSSVGTHTILYDYTDIGGNAAPQLSRTVTIVDNIAPVITLTGSSTVTHDAGTTYTDAGASATDNVDGSITLGAPTSTVNTSQIGTYTVTYTATDTAGNSSTATRIVNVVDNTLPVITVTGSNPVYVQYQGSYTDQGATATDTFVRPSYSVTLGYLASSAMV